MLGSHPQAQPKGRTRPKNQSLNSKAKVRYFMAWRWHFYAGLFVIPFMLMLSLTGLTMLFDDEIEQFRYGEILNVIPQDTVAPISKQLEAINNQYPKSNVTQLVYPKKADLANRFNIHLAEGGNKVVTVDPYSAKVLGEIDRSDSWYELANDIHGTLLIGKAGDYLIEIATSLSLLLLISGIYLWLPTDNSSKAGFLKLRMVSGRRILLRDLHANLGGVLSVVLCLFLLSGLAWAGVWGAKMVQAWNTFPTYYTWGEKPQSTLTHADLNHGSEEEMPWNLELAEVPQSHHSGEHQLSTQYRAKSAVDADSIVNQAKQLGFERFSLYFPQSDMGVYTVSANSMAGEVTDPRQDRTTHFDQYSGQVLMDVTWDDYSWIAKLMATGVSLHQGDLSMVNKVLNALFCLAFIVISITGALMWWMRRPAKQRRLGVPAHFEHDGIWKLGVISVVLIAVCFPMAGVGIIVTLIMDALLVQRSKALKAYLS